MNQLSWGELMLAGGLAGMVSWSVSNIFHPYPPPPIFFPHKFNINPHALSLPPGNLPPRRPQNPNPIRPARPTYPSNPSPNDTRGGLPRGRPDERDEGVL